MNIEMPLNVNYVLQILKENNYLAYIVGGSVRDILLNREPKDWDITTNCLPEKIIEIFKDYSVIPTGLKHGTVTMIIDDMLIEITTFRTDGEYSDNRRPDEIKFTNSLIEDLSRRDFTINAIAYNYKEGLIDPFNGQKDLKNKLISCVGNENDRLKEDALRMLRAIRFSAQLGFEIEEHTQNAIKNNSKLIKHISPERISQELNKILLYDAFKLWDLIYLGLAEEILPELDLCMWTEQNNPYHLYGVGKHIIYSVKNIENILYLKLTMLLHDIGKLQCKTTDDKAVDHFYGHQELSSEMAVKILRRLKYDNYTIMKVRDLVLYHDIDIQDNKKSVRKWLNKIGEENFRDLLKVKEADISAQNPVYYKERHNKLENIKIILEDVLYAQECFSKKDLAINGSDLIELGFPQGKGIGIIINNLVEKVIENPELNTKEKLIVEIFKDKVWIY